MPLQGGPGGPERPGRSPAVSGRPAKRSAFWDALKAAAVEEGVPVSRLIARIDAERAGCGLSSAIRVWLLARFRAQTV
jgi:Ribbon-helix-helix domain